MLQFNKIRLSPLLCLALICGLLPSGVPLKAQSPVLPSSATASIHIETGLQIPMRDGVILNAAVYRPAAVGSFPTLYMATPYPAGSEQSARNEALFGHYVLRHYAVVLVNVRGTGHSGGEYAFLSREEQQDHYEVVAWIRGQDWSDGRIAGFGSGYSATSQWLTALQNPPGLACIAPVGGVLSPYHDWAFPGGVASKTFLQGWYEEQLRIPHAIPTTGAPRYLSLDLQLSMLEHRYFDAWWQERDARQRLEQLQVPVFMIRHWDNRSPGAASTLQAAQRLNVRHRTLVMEADSPGFHDSALHNRELLPFYDWCLKGLDTGFIAGPELRFEVPGRTLEKRDSRWPPGNVSYTPLFLDPANSHLGFESPGNEQTITLPTEETLRVTSGPLVAPLEINGPLMMTLSVATDRPDLALQISLLERRWRAELPGGEVTLPDFLNPGSSALPDAIAGEPQLLSRGFLKLSARLEDEAFSSEYQPQYSGTQAASVISGRYYDLRIAMQPVAQRFQPGSELIVELSQVQDASLRHGQAIAHIAMDESRRPRLWLPMTQGQDAISPPTAPANPDTAETNLINQLFNSESSIILLPPQEPMATQQPESD